jgi:hypothetical protein
MDHFLFVMCMLVISVQGFRLERLSRRVATLEKSNANPGAH